MSEVTVSFDMSTAAFYDAPEQELEHVMLRATALIANTPCGPSGFVSTLLDSNGNTIGKVTVRQ